MPKMCQLERGSLSEKLLRIEKVPQNRTTYKKVTEQNLCRPRFKF